MEARRLKSGLALLAGLPDAIESPAFREAGLLRWPSRREVTRRIDRQAEPGDQFCRLIEIVQRDHFDRAVHVPVRNADESRRHAASCQLKLSRIVAGRRGQTVDLNGDFGEGRSFHESRELGRGPLERELGLGDPKQLFGIERVCNRCSARSEVRRLAATPTACVQSTVGPFAPTPLALGLNANVSFMAM